jgi:hypothetical protein
MLIAGRWIAGETIFVQRITARMLPRDGNVGARVILRSIRASVLPEGGNWEAKINVNYERLHLGVFPNECEAAIAYNVAAAYFHEEYANLNKLPEGIGWDGFPASADD